MVAGSVDGAVQWSQFDARDVLRAVAQGCEFQGPPAYGLGELLGFGAAVDEAPLLGARE